MASGKIGGKYEKRTAEDFISGHVPMDDRNVEGIDECISELEQELNTALSDVAHLVDRSYQKFVPEILAENKLLNKLNDVMRSAESSENEIRQRIAAIEKDIQDYKAKGFLLRLSHLRECKETIAVLEDIEQNFVRLLHTPVEADEDSALVNARLIADTEQRIDSINKNEADIEGVVMDRIYPVLQEQLETMKASLAVYLTNFFENLFEMSSDESTNLRVLKVACEHPSKVSKHLSAMQTLGLLDSALARLCTWILRDMCAYIIRSKTPEDVFSLNESVGAIVGKREYRIRTDLPTAEALKKPNPTATFETLAKFFESLSDDCKGVSINDVSLIGMIGKKICAELVDMLVKECLTPAVPYSNDERSDFEVLLNEADDLHKHLIQLGLFTADSVTFKQFADSYNTVFINRRCTAFIQKARSLINAPFVPLVDVGSGELEKRQATEAFKKANSFVGKTFTSEHCPSLMQFMRCKISDSCSKLWDIIEECLREAANADSDVAAGRLFQTALNMVQLYVLIAPRQHEAQLSSVPLMTAVFYNNCHYLTHCLMGASIDLHPAIVKAMNGVSCGISLIESVPRLRKVAAELMECQLAQCRRQISTILSDDQMFIGLHQNERLNMCEKTLDGCFMHLKQIATVWREVLTETVYGNSVGDLVSYMLTTINQFVLKTEDIRASDSQIMVYKMQQLLKNVEGLFTFGNDKRSSSIHRFTENSYYRTKEIIFCLDASLEDLSDRWCNGKGPMAQWLSAVEVRGLIKALFQNTAKRSKILATIK
ncbi:unnamed protein product [Anisakis simplex]|uniref:Exocyst complex component Sec10 n=1 Tax=Anisakis simplex TaxID=6269 RepID=A0A158PNL7_ANISI|nr:unnamed protein product [Anisakis simplex]